MNYVNDILYQWLKYSSPETEWIISDINQAPPKPQNDEFFGYIRVINAKPLSFGGVKQKYNESEDKFDVTLRNFFEIEAHIEVNSKQGSNSSGDPNAADVADKIVAFLYDENIKELFYENNVGLLSVPILRNLSSEEDAQVRKRFIVELKLNIKTEYEYQVDRIVKAPYVLDIQN